MRRHLGDYAYVTHLTRADLEAPPPNDVLEALWYKLDCTHRWHEWRDGRRIYLSCLFCGVNPQVLRRYFGRTERGGPAEPFAGPLTYDGELHLREAAESTTT